MEAADILWPPYRITADPLVMNLKEETPGVIRSNVDLMMPLYSLVPTVKLEPELGIAVEEPGGSKFTNSNLSVSDDGPLAMNEVDTEKCYVETLVSRKAKLATLEVPCNLIPNFVDNEDEKFQSIPEILTTVNEYNDLKLATLKTRSPDYETRREKTFFNEPEYPKTLNMSELNIRASGSIVIQPLNVAPEPIYIKKEPELMSNVSTNSSGDAVPFGIVRNPEVPLLPFASEMILGNCEVPLLPDGSVLNSSELGESEALLKRKTDSGSLNSEKLNPRFTDLEETNESVRAVGCDEAAEVAKSYVSTVKNGKISSSDFSKPVTAPKQEQKIVKSSKKAANCTSSTISSKEAALTPKGCPKPILLSNEQWKEAPDSFNYYTQGHGMMNRHKGSIYFNQKVRIKTVKVVPSPRSGKCIPHKEKLIFIEGKGWACDRCEQIFPTSHFLEEHKRGCRVDGIACTRCPRVFDTLQGFRAHYVYCQKSVYKCPECPKVFTQVPLYEHHYPVHQSDSSESVYICIDCSPPRNFKSKAALRAHVMYHHLSLKVMCKTCGELKHFTHKCRKGPVIVHEESACKVCGKLIRLKQIESHMRLHEKVTCEACGKVVRLKTIKKHMHLHDMKNIVCAYCGLHFIAKTSLQKHLKTHNDTGNPAASMCIHCGKFFELKTELVKHLKEHESERSFICEHCGKGFFRVHHLDTHLLSHKEKQFICPKCNRGFALKHQLAAHLRTLVCGGNNVMPSAKDNTKLVKKTNVKSRSLPKKQYTGQNAEKAFVSKHQLASHLRTVSRDKNASSKSKHVSHDKAKRKGEKNNAKPCLSFKNQFICANCDQKFIHKRQLVAHFGTASCGSSAVSSTKKEDSKKSSPVPKEQFITAFENFVHERQLAASCDSVTCSGDVISSEEKPEALIKTRKGKEEQMKPLYKNQRENSGHCFVRKRRFASRSSTASCGDSVLPSLEMTEKKKSGKKLKIKIR